MKYTTPNYEFEVVETEDILEQSTIYVGKGFHVDVDKEEDFIEVEVPDVSILL